MRIKYILLLDSSRPPQQDPGSRCQEQDALSYRSNAMSGLRRMGIRGRITGLPSIRVADAWPTFDAFMSQSAPLREVVNP